MQIKKLILACCLLKSSSAGQVGDVYDLLTRYDNTIVGEYYLPVRHCLLGLKGADIDKIQTVYSHPQGLMQCGKLFQMSIHPGSRSVRQIRQWLHRRSLRKIIQRQLQ